MVRSFEVEGFKAFGSTGRVPLRPITLIYGANSSGKSSLLQALLLLRQSVVSDNRDLLLSPKGQDVDLGGFRELIFNHEVGRPLRFRFELEPLTTRRMSIGQPSVAFDFRYREKSRSVELAHLAMDAFGGPLASFVWSAVTQDDEPTAFQVLADRRPYNWQFANNMRIDAVHWDNRFWREEYARTGRAVGRTMRQLLESTASTSRQRRGQSRLRPLAPLLNLQSLTPSQIAEARRRYRRYTYQRALADYASVQERSGVGLSGFLPASLSWHAANRRIHSGTAIEALLKAVLEQSGATDLGELAVVFGDQVRQFLSQLVYLGPLREYPERHYIYSGAPTRTVGKSGKQLPDVLYANRSLVGEVNDELERFGLGYELKVNSVVEHDPSLEDVFALRLADRSSGVNVSIRDVGFGISQVLPVIVQSMLSRRRTIMVEQPEIHLHPQLQAELGDVFARCIAPPRSNQFIIETHSEHLMLRLQGLIRRGDLDRDDVAVLYVDRDSDGARVLHLRLDADGDFIDAWPGGFFEEDYRELFGTD